MAGLGWDALGLRQAIFSAAAAIGGQVGATNGVNGAKWLPAWDYRGHATQRTSKRAGRCYKIIRGTEGVDSDV
eukprot:scaffold81793_cov14-Prasinocladus_malaysianus.AAC.1